LVELKIISLWSAPG